MMTDGGGVRGLSSLLILKHLMTRLNTKRSAARKKELLPFEVFDLIGGTSTGGFVTSIHSNYVSYLTPQASWRSC